MKQIFDLQKGMTQAISHFSRHEDAKAVVQNGKYIYSGEDQKNAFVKIRRFYRIAIGMLIVVAIILFISTADFGSRNINSAQASTPISHKAAATHGQ